MFLEYFEIIYQIFQKQTFLKTKIKIYVKSTVIFLKMADIDNNKLMGLLIIAEGGLLQSQEHIRIKEGRKRRQ